MSSKNRFIRGIKDGIPIALGYFPVSFTFGILAVSLNIPPFIAILVSLTNLTSAGQFAGLPLFITEGAYLELALTQLVINLRYALMSLSLSQKVDNKWHTLDRMILAHGITDEIFAVSSNTKDKISRAYFLGLMSLPIIGWTLGTYVGCIASSLLDHKLQNALGLAIYGMFLAIIIPAAKKDRDIKLVVVISAISSIIINYLNNFIGIGSGFIIIICTLISAGTMAILHPKEDS
ncbi:MAG: AzlC family ABC transporter permease [Erysipelotrichaceae bacterium]|nr:AzlC family ABC transporter permease [Erysipelotrichaceae bacterium]MDY5251957.1 AzlC family ABC transporter permease [Erysipelotrichaceae bacterium]